MLSIHYGSEGSFGHIASVHILPSAGRCSTRLRSGTTCLKSSLENRWAHSRGHKLRYCNFVAWTAPLSRRSSLLHLLIYCTDLISTTQTVHITAVHPKHNTSIKPTPVILLVLECSHCSGNMRALKQNSSLIIPVLTCKPILRPRQRHFVQK